MKGKKANNHESSRIPENDPSKAMDSKKEVEQSPDEKTDQDFPGYPHYPAKEDIMDQRTDSHRVDMDVENLPNSRNVTGVSQRFLAGQDRERAEEAMIPGPATDDDLGIKPGTEADVTDEDLAVLNSTDAEIGVPQNVSNEDLKDEDLPGSVLDEVELSDEDDLDNVLNDDNHDEPGDRS